MSYSFVKKWAALFKGGRESVEDDERSGRPAVTQENVAAVENFVMKNRCVSVRHHPSGTFKLPLPDEGGW